MDNPEEQKNKDITQKTKEISNTDPTKNWGSTQMLAKGKQFLPLIGLMPNKSELGERK